MMLRSIEYTHALCSTLTSSSFVNKAIYIALAVFILWFTECSKFENFFFNSEYSARLAESACWEVLYLLRARTAACNGQFCAHNGVGQHMVLHTEIYSEMPLRCKACSPGSQLTSKGKPTVAYSIRAQSQAPKQRQYDLLNLNHCSEKRATWSHHSRLPKHPHPAHSRPRSMPLAAVGQPNGIQAAN
jgi:hypothetical protein